VFFYSQHLYTYPHVLHQLSSFLATILFIECMRYYSCWLACQEPATGAAPGVECGLAATPADASI